MHPRAVAQPADLLGDDAAMLAAALRFRELWPDRQGALQACIWAHLRHGDYAEGEVAKRVDTPKLVGDIVTTWLK